VRSRSFLEGQAIRGAFCLGDNGGLRGAVLRWMEVRICSSCFSISDLAGPRLLAHVDCVRQDLAAFGIVREY